MEQINRNRLSESIVRMMVDSIKKGVYPPGTKMPPEREIMTMLGVGRSTLREAFQSLAIMGILDIRSGQGTFVKDVSKDVIISPHVLAPLVDPEAAAEFLEVRLIVEPSIARLAARRHTAEEYKEMHDLLDTCEEYIAAGTSVNGLNGNFHLLIARSSQNAVLVRFIESIIGMLVARTEQMRKQEDFLRWELSSHRRVLRAIESREADAAGRAMEKHIVEVTERHRKLKF